MLSIFQAFIIGLIQGATELFPISSLGHSVIIPGILGWNIHQNDNYFISFLVATHLATAIVLFVFFWKDWIKIIQGLGRSFKKRVIDEKDIYARLGWLLVTATIPAGILGLLLEHSLRSIFASAQIAAFFLIINGIILLVAEKMRTRKNIGRENEEHLDIQISKLSWRQSVAIGSAQAAALLPGISRSGTSMAGGLIAGLNNEEAARFSFLLATPIIGAAALLKVPTLFQPMYAPLRIPMVVGFLSAGITAFISVRFLVKFFETKNLKPFAIYCLVAGLVYSLILFIR
ncbi:MAG: undecaprenyl-diphosphate phosphatase [Candidatus Saccharimonadales bacterium]